MALAIYFRKRPEYIVTEFRQRVSRNLKHSASNHRG